MQTTFLCDRPELYQRMRTLAQSLISDAQLLAYRLFGVRHYSPHDRRQGPLRRIHPRISSSGYQRLAEADMRESEEGNEESDEDSH